MVLRPQSMVSYYVLWQSVAEKTKTRRRSEQIILSILLPVMPGGCGKAEHKKTITSVFLDRYFGCFFHWFNVCKKSHTCPNFLCVNLTLAQPWQSYKSNFGKVTQKYLHNIQVVTQHTSSYTTDNWVSL